VTDFLRFREDEGGEPRYGEDPLGRPINRHLSLGIINLDKPSGPSSHEVSAWVKRMLGLKKVGHGGTLEANAGEIPPCPACYHWRLKTLPEFSNPS